MEKEYFVKETHYPKLQAWMESHNFPCPPLETIPDIGLIVDDAAMGFLFLAQSGKLSFVEFVCTNKEKDKEHRQKAIDVLFDTLVAQAKDLGMKVCLSFSKLDRYSEHLERNGFQLGDADMKHYLKIL